jgi:hypothetical protein
VVETIAAVTAVTANEIALSMIEGKWQGELAGEVPSVTVVAFDGNNNETLVLTTGK